MEPRRTEILLNGMWEARTGDAASAPWAPVRVPEELTPKARNPIQYRLRFSLPRGLRRDRRALLTFSKAGHHVGIVLNGKAVGDHYGVRLPFSFDVTDVLREGTENELLVSAYPADAAHARPGGVASADEAKAYDIFLVAWPPVWYPPGIFGDVVLRLLPAIRVEDVFVRTSFRQQTLDATVEVANQGRSSAKVTIRTEALALDGTPTKVRLTDETVPVPSGGRATAERSATFPDAVPWPDGGGGTPPLYVLRTTLLVNRQPVDVVSRRFAFREVWTEGGDVILNGRKLLLVADSVTFLTERERLAYLLHALRSAGVNLVYLHWDDATDSFYDLADEAGMLVMPGLYCSGPPPRTWPVVAGPAWADDMGREYEAWVKLRRNHPSIALWYPYDMAPTSGVRRADLDGFERRVSAADPTRPLCRRDFLTASIGDVKTFLRDRRDPLRREYDERVATARLEHRPLIVSEIANFGSSTADDVSVLLQWFKRDAVDGYGGLLLENDLFVPQPFQVNWPSVSGSDGRPLPEGGTVTDVVNWADPSRPSFALNFRGRALRDVAKRVLGNAPAPLDFVRSPELLVIGPGACGRRGYAFAAPVSGAGAVERGTRLDPAGRGWLVLTEPGTYRVRVACDRTREKTVEVRGRPFSVEPGYAHLQEVRLDQ